MTSERCGQQAEERSAPIDAGTGHGADDGDPIAMGGWSGCCGPDFGSRGDQWGEAASGTTSTAGASRAKGMFEPWRSMMAAMGGGSGASSCFGVADQQADSPSADAAVPTDHGK